MQKWTKILVCSLMIGSMILTAAPAVLPVLSESVSAASSTTSGTVGDVKWSFNRTTGTLRFQSLKEDTSCSTNLTIYEGKAYLYHKTPTNITPLEDYCTPEWLAPWEEYREDIRVIQLDANVSLPDEEGYFQSLPSESIQCDVGDGYSWAYDCETDTLTFNGTGPHSYNHMKEEEDGSIHSVESFYAFSNYSFIQPGTVVLSDGLTEVESYPECDRLVIGKTVELRALNVRKEYVVDEDNPLYAAYEGALYSKDYKKLISLPSEMTKIPAHPNLEILGSSCLSGDSMDNPIVIPWGVTTIESGALFNAASIDRTMTFVFPDTTTTIEDSASNRSADTHRIFSVQNSEAMKKIFATTSDWGAVASIEKVASVLSYYDIQPGSWKTIGDRTWYFDENGKMATGTVTIDGKSYTFNQAGVLQTDGSDSARNGFVTENGKTYYFKDGAILTGLQYIGGKAYIFDKDGVMQKSGWYMTSRGDTYYLNDYGAGVVNCWRYKDGNYKYVNPDGTIEEMNNTYQVGYCYLGLDGVMVQWNWVQDYGKWYYVTGSGVRYESLWQKINGNWYWFGGSGKMAQSQWLQLDGKWYYFTDSGAMAHDTWVNKDGKQVYLGSDGAMQ